MSPAGSDSNDGLTQTTPWQSIWKINTFVFGDDSVYLEGGQTFTGSIDREFTLPILISSYREGKATIYSGILEAIAIGNSSHITIRNLTLRGAGYMTTSMWTSGLDLYIDDPVNRGDILVENVDVSGYGGPGILVTSYLEGTGFEFVTISKCVSRDNGVCGILVTSDWVGRELPAHGRITIADCKAFHNYGRKDYTANWSGSGILLSGARNSLITGCEAHENGRDNACTSAGPIGIWIDNCLNSAIRSSVSHHNSGGVTKVDGGGFDIDGGCYGCTIEGCASFFNEGCGYGLFQWQTVNDWSNNTIRNCSSDGDAYNTRYGAFTLWGAGGSHKVTNAEIYGNRITMNTGWAIKTIGSNMEDIRIHDNSFCLTSTAKQYNTLPSSITVTNSIFPCTVLALDTTHSPRPAADRTDLFWPNPVTGGVLNIRVRLPTGKPCRLQVLGSLGQLLQDRPASSNMQVRLNYSPGVYRVLVRSDYQIIVTKNILLP